MRKIKPKPLVLKLPKDAPVVWVSPTQYYMISQERWEKYYNEHKEELEAEAWARLRRRFQAVFGSYDNECRE